MSRNSNKTSFDVISTTIVFCFALVLIIDFKRNVKYYSNVAWFSWRRESLCKKKKIKNKKKKWKEKKKKQQRKKSPSNSFSVLVFKFSFGHKSLKPILKRCQDGKEKFWEMANSLLFFCFCLIYFYHHFILDFFPTHL